MEYVKSYKKFKIFHEEDIDMFTTFIDDLDVSANSLNLLQEKITKMKKEDPTIKFTPDFMETYISNRNMPENLDYNIENMKLEQEVQFMKAKLKKTPLSGPFLIFMLVPCIVNAYLTGNILVGVVTFILQFLIAPMLTGRILITAVSDDEYSRNPGLYAGISNLIIGFIIVGLTYYFF